MKSLLVVIALAAFAFPTSVGAKKGAGYHIPNWEERPDEMAWLVARCSASVNSDEARAVFAHVPYSNASMIATTLATQTGCHQSSSRDWTLTVEHSILRGGLAEELLDIDFDGVMSRSVRRPRPVFDPIPVEDFTQLPPASQQALVLIEFGECVAIRNTSGVREYLQTDLLSVEEGAVITELSDDFAVCMFEENNVQFTRPSLRAFIAEGAYRVTVAHEIALRQSEQAR